MTDNKYTGTTTATDKTQQQKDRTNQGQTQRPLTGGTNKGGTTGGLGTDKTRK